MSILGPQNSLNAIFYAVIYVIFCTLIIGCSSNPKGAVSDVLSPSKQCLTPPRAAMDVGSGSTKLKIAVFDSCLNRIHSVIYAEQVPLGLKENLEKNAFSKEFLEVARGKIVELAMKSPTYGIPISKIKAVGTQALRDAINADSLISALRKSNLHVRVISQIEEAELGHRAAVTDKSGDKPADKPADKLTDQALDPAMVTSFDIGGGSFQVFSLVPKTSILAGTLASISFKDHIVEKIQKKKPGSSPNPIQPEEAKQAITFAENYAKELKRLNPLFVFQRDLVGLGGVFGFSIAQQIGKSRVRASDIEAAYPKLIARKSEQIPGQYRETESTNLLLVLGLLKGFGLEDREIEIKKANLTDGLIAISGD